VPRVVRPTQAPACAQRGGGIRTQLFAQSTGHQVQHKRTCLRGIWNTLSTVNVHTSWTGKLRTHGCPALSLCKSNRQDI
jgi:hypothetical protein